MGPGGWTFLVALAMAIGLAGIAVPVLPGILVLWFAALIYGFAVGFGSLGVLVMVIMTSGVALSIASSIIIPKKAADDSGADGSSQLIGLIGAVIGFFVIPVIGLFVGGLAGILLAEYLRLQDFNAAWRATKGVARGFGKSAVVDFALGIVMVTAWALWALTVIW